MTIIKRWLEKTKGNLCVHHLGPLLIEPETCRRTLIPPIVGVVLQSQFPLYSTPQWLSLAQWQRRGGGKRAQYKNFPYGHVTTVPKSQLLLTLPLSDTKPWMFRITQLDCCHYLWGRPSTLTDALCWCLGHTLTHFTQLVKVFGIINPWPHDTFTLRLL